MVHIILDVANTTANGNHPGESFSKVSGCTSDVLKFVRRTKNFEEDEVITSSEPLVSIKITSRLHKKENCLTNS